MAKIIILNGPAGCGKDTIANLLVRTGAFSGKLSFKTPMFEIAKEILGSNYDKFVSEYDNRDKKEAPEAFLGGMSRRQFMIWISEDVIKPVFGSEYFGERLAASVTDGVFVIADGGFDAEVNPLVAAGHDIYIARLRRDGFAFEGDSRTYLKPRSDCRMLDILLEHGSPEKAVRIIQYWI